MKKQSRGHAVDRQDVSMVTPFPGQSVVGTKPHGVHARGRSKPTQLEAGAAESKTKPVEMPRRATRSNAAGTQSAPGTQSTRNRTH